MDDYDVLTRWARGLSWEIFSPDWDYLRRFPTFQLNALCALSVSLDPRFALASWVLNVAVPHFDGTFTDDDTASHFLQPAPDDYRAFPVEPDGIDQALDAPTWLMVKTETPPTCPIYPQAKPAAIATTVIQPDPRAELLDEFLKRVRIAAEHLTPFGKLPFVGELDQHFPEQTRVNIDAFAEWAEGEGWTLPPEFPRAAKEAKPLTTRERDTLLVIIAALCHNKDIDPAQTGVAKRIEAMTIALGARVSDDVIKKILKNIPAAVESRRGQS